ncbi:6-O-methylguanine DNA methyltransferase, DNA binding domain protein [Gleimia coleocanis DSM 15436]|uniref:Methylated-DNA--protein-cysteine methyltransferase n=1 Tax=Gleimia coleocanis DSM 15436 TaxID=525245 RepID=C0VZD5_9ACTO|nr:methylated-DNA--[protein]-cysteine S-methyltransferase [Gleimia coleocanis]EEH64236.1 6-O-methylguanine DNA methyltransferase, DNA binding domain protein [Gleimia coleocanis DSM 15436]
MYYAHLMPSPLGEILLESDATALTGVWFSGTYPKDVDLKAVANSEPPEILQRAEAWLTAYFAGENPALDLPLKPQGTPFQHEVWKYLLEIPYGRTVTYGWIAKQIATERNIARMSAQAVGGAVGSNPISILVPCHRVVGANGKLTGYASGLERKEFLLALESAGNS